MKIVIGTRGSKLAVAQAEYVKRCLEEKYPDCDVELNYGGQPIYYYILSVDVGRKGCDSVACIFKVTP